MALFQLTYVSTAASVMSGAEVEGIVAEAFERNAARGVTGLLLFNGTNFMQTLEGDRDTVRDLMATITADPRHTGVIIIHSGPVTARSFEGWAMHLVQTARAGQDDRGLDDNAFDPALLPNGVSATLKSLYRGFNSLAMTPL